MQGISEAFKTELRRGGTMVSRVEVYDPNGQLLASSDPGSDPQLNIEDGSVNVDGSADIERTCTLDLVDPTGTLTRPVAFDLLSVVSSNEIVPYRGLRLPDGTEEYVRCGTFVITDQQTVDTPDTLMVKLKGADRSIKVRQDPPGSSGPKPIVVSRGTNVVELVTDLVAERLPGIRIAATNTSFTTPSLVIRAVKDLLCEIHRILAAAGILLHFDVFGDCVITEIPDPKAPDPVVVFEYVEGQNSHILDLGRSSSRATAFNGVIVEGYNSTNAEPVRGEAWDDDPDSPTYYLGPFGRNPKEIRSEIPTTNAQCEAMARGELFRLLGTPEQVNFTGLVNPAHEVGDLVKIGRERSGMNDVFALDEFTIPFRAKAAMPSRTRERRL